jgi:hypothetical protein
LAKSNTIISVCILLSIIDVKSCISPISCVSHDLLLLKLCWNLVNTLLFSRCFITLETICLNLGQTPIDWKRAYVCPIFKKGACHEPANNRPVSLTCILCKLMKHETYCLQCNETPRKQQSID